MAERLRGIDAALLAIETPNAHLHTGMLAILDPSGAPAGWSFESVRALVSSRLHLSPLFRRRVIVVPLELHHPVWADDPDFDLDGHVRRLTVAPPGGHDELLDAVAAMMAVPLDRQRPLWELHVAEGLTGGRVAVLAKSHHAASDGVSGTELLVRLLDVAPMPAPSVVPEDPPWRPAPLPTDGELLADALAALVGRPAEAAAAVRGTVDLLGRLWRRPEAGEAPAAPMPPRPFSAPRTSLNTVLSGPQRRVALAAVSLDEVRTVKEYFGATVNDVVLALCAGALRSWLIRRGEDPGGDLVALVPASVRTQADQGALGNRVSPMLVSLATSIQDPSTRLAAICAGARAAKAQERDVGSAVLAGWAEVAPPAIVTGAALMASALRLVDLIPPVYNVSVSNLVGPPLPLYLAGARVMAAHPLGPIVDGGALNVTVLSYDGTLWFGLVADREVVDGLESIAAGLVDALAELARSADAATDGDAPGPAGQH